MSDPANFREFYGSTGQDAVAIGTEDGALAIKVAGASPMYIKGTNTAGTGASYTFVVPDEGDGFAPFAIQGTGNTPAYIPIGTENHTIRAQIVSGDNASDVPGITIVGGPTGTDPIWLSANHVVIANMPTVDPHVVGALWNSAGTVHISAG